MVEPAKKARPVRSQAQALDDFIMGTNDSSIVSKRSVERFYYPHEPHFFRYFVHKPPRRSPLVNRGYWLRLKAIDVVVEQFLARPSHRKKVVINLGCGYDVLPWQCHTQYAKSCENALFVDIDYPDLMQKKRKAVLETPALRELLDADFSVSKDPKDPVLIKSSKYCQLGCDLRQLENVRKTLASLTSLEDSEVLFVAEVSITYMDTLSADAVIEWASSIGKAEFCLLEQLLPLGPDHAFAKTMLNHFEKFNSPLKSVHKYATQEKQRSRFGTRGWKHVNTWDLWQVWSGDDFLSSNERTALDDIEPFDEWEEFMLFGRHYVVVHAIAAEPLNPKSVPNIDNLIGSVLVSCESKAISHATPMKRRFGGGLITQTASGEHLGAHILGLGSDSRSDTYDLYALDGETPPYKLPHDGPSPRMCFTVTDLGEQGTLLVGGRSSPGRAFSDAWLLEKGPTSSWRRSDLPTPLYRHCAVRVRGTSMALIVGGKTSATHVSEDVFVFHSERGWLKCKVQGTKPEATFGANIFNSSESDAPNTYEGHLSGGMRQDGTLVSRQYVWRLDMNDAEPSISFQEIQTEGALNDVLTTFGAQIVELDSCVAICGGMGQSAAIQGNRVSLVSTSDKDLHLIGVSSPQGAVTKWPLIVGSSVLAKGSCLVVLGGGATCYAFGTYWETGSFLIDVSKVLGIAAPSVNAQICRYLVSPQMASKTGTES